MSNFDPNQPVQQVYVQFAPKPQSNGLAIASLILGIVGAALSLIPIAGIFLCWLPALLAIIFGFIGVGTANRAGGFRRTQAIAGIVCGFLPVPIILILLALVVPFSASSGS
ncbi:DUF4190 domain-containing protein [Frondihabitans australicus]|nr:DUF4190 domain-containing protein [Frondihabitans australicus]